MEFKLYLVADSEDQIMRLIKAGYQRILISFYYARSWSRATFKALSELVRKKKCEVICDSGGATYQGKNKFSVKVESCDIEEYVKFLNDHSDIFSFAFSLDPLDYNRDVDLQSIEKMNEKCKVKVVPVLHSRDPVSQLKSFCERFDCVGLAVDVRYHVKLCCKKVHLLGVGSPETLKKFVRFLLPSNSLELISADTAKWVHGSSKGFVYLLKGGRLSRIHYNKDRLRLKGFRDVIERMGFKLEDVEMPETRDLINIETFKNVERFVEEYCSSFLKNRGTNRGGPVTETGKLVSSLNSLTHGRYAKLPTLLEKLNLDPTLKEECMDIINKKLDYRRELNEIAKGELLKYKISEHLFWGSDDLLDNFVFRAGEQQRMAVNVFKLLKNMHELDVLERETRNRKNLYSVSQNLK